MLCAYEIIIVKNPLDGCEELHKGVLRVPFPFLIGLVNNILMLAHQERKK